MFGSTLHSQVAVNKNIWLGVNPSILLLFQVTKGLSVRNLNASVTSLRCHVTATVVREARSPVA